MAARTGADRPCNALIVDDERPIRRLVRLLLENEGYQVHEAETGDLGFKWPPNTGRTWCCWIWDCPTWTALRLCGGRVNGVRRPSWCRRCAIVKLMKLPPWTTARTIISPSPLARRNCWRGCGRCVGAPPSRTKARCSSAASWPSWPALCQGPSRTR